jgi:biotin synthase-like enzyme
MLDDLQIDEIEFIFRLIDDGHLPDSVTIEFLNWLEKTDTERYALLNWMLLRWVYIRDHKYHLPKRFINLSNSV